MRIKGETYSEWTARMDREQAERKAQVARWDAERRAAERIAPAADGTVAGAIRARIEARMAEGERW